MIASQRIMGPTLVIGGSGEFTDGSDAISLKTDAAQLHAIYNRMHVDAGWLGVAERDWFIKQTGLLPKGYLAVDQIPVVHQSEVGDKRIGIVLFPADQSTWTDKTDELLRIADSLRTSCDLVVGVSPWGLSVERDFLATAAGHYDVILGGGTGGGMRGNMDTKGSILWARGFAKGKSLPVLELMEWPRRSPDWTWIENDNVRFPVVILNESVAPDQAIESLLAN